MPNIQPTTQLNHDNNSLSANQTINPNDTYLKLVNQLETPAEIKKFCERLIAIHNINSTPEHQIKIGNSTTTNELHPKFNAWVARIFDDNITKEEIATLAILFDVFDTYKSNMNQDIENIKIKVLETIFAKYGKNTALEQLRNNISKFLESIKKITYIQPMLAETPDIEQITTNVNVEAFNCRHVKIVHMLIEHLDSDDIAGLLFLLNINHQDIDKNNYLEYLNKIMKNLDNNYSELVSRIKETGNLALVRKIRELL